MVADRGVRRHRGRWYNHLADKGLAGRTPGSEDGAERPRQKTDSRKRAAVMVVPSATHFQQNNSNSNHIRTTGSTRRHGPTTPPESKEFLSAVLAAVLDNDDARVGQAADDAEDIIDLSPPASPRKTCRLSSRAAKIVSPTRRELPPIKTHPFAEGAQPAATLPSIGSWYTPPAGPPLPVAARAAVNPAGEGAGARPWYSSTILRNSGFAGNQGGAGTSRERGEGMGMKRVKTEVA